MPVSSDAMPQRLTNLGQRDCSFDTETAAMISCDRKRLLKRKRSSTDWIDCQSYRVLLLACGQVQSTLVPHAPQYRLNPIIILSIDKTGSTEALGLVQSAGTAV